MVEDIAFTLNYYRGVLGFEVLHTVPASGDELRRATVKKGDVEINFQIEESLKKELPEIRREEPGGGFTLVIKMTGVDEFYNHLYASLDVVSQLKDTSLGMRQFTIRDINGYYLTFTEPTEN